MFVAEPQHIKWTNDRVLCAWNNGLMLSGNVPNTKGMLGGNWGDAGWKLHGEVRKRPKYLNWVFANIIYYNNNTSRNRNVPFIHWNTFQHARFSCEFLQMLQLIPKYPIHIRNLKERCKDIYELTFAMGLPCSRRSDQKNDNIFFFNMICNLHTESLPEAAYYSWGVCPWP